MYVFIKVCVRVCVCYYFRKYGSKHVVEHECKKMDGFLYTICYLYIILFCELQERQRLKTK